MALGQDLTDLSDVELRSALYRASASIDAYCNVPLLPQRHDFRGGTVTAEVHEWPVDMYETRAKPFRFWPWHQPVQAVTTFRIYSTPNIYTEIAAADCFINNSAGFIEASSLKLTQYGIFGAGVINAIVGMWAPQAQVSYTYGYSFSEVDEPLDATDAAVYSAQHQWWAATPAPIIKKNGTVVSTGFTIDSTEGTVTFATPLAATDYVTATYNHTLPWQIAQATAIIAAEDLGESALRAKGMGGINALTVGEITLRRAGARGTSSAAVADNISEKTQMLLAPFIFETLR
jgi:hypothetical protein